MRISFRTHQKFFSQISKTVRLELSKFYFLFFKNKQNNLNTYTEKTILNKTYKVAIVGGGASGLICAVELSSLLGDGKDIVILERTDRVGKKIIATGNGQCNLGNANFSSEFYHGDKGFIEQFIHQANDIDLDGYLYSLGIPIITEENGKKYPVSKQASAVLDTIRARLSSYNVCTLTDFMVSDISFNNGIFMLSSGNGKVQAEQVVIATGGKAGKQFGTDGFGYSLAKKFNHKLTPLYPSLVQVKTELDKIRGLKGLKERVIATAYDGKEKLATCTGDLLFTEFGVSGSAIFTLSAYLSGAKDPKIVVEFLPGFNLEETKQLIVDRKKNATSESGEKVFNCLINKRIGQAVYKTAKSDKASDLAYALKNFTLTVKGTLDFASAQVTKGGIDTADITNKYESKLQKGLYLTGEILNVDGDCGGYNLMFAFTTGIVVARDIVKR